MLRIIRAKLKGKKPEIEPLTDAPPADAEVIDLMSRLRESLVQGKEQHPAAKRGRSGRARTSRKAAASDDAPDSRRSA